MKVILASTSPRRRELLAGCGIDFIVADKYPCEEIYPTSTPVREVPLYLSQLKSKSYPKALDNDQLLLTADTVVIIDNQILGKPKSREAAIEMLQKLSGRTHSVITGVTLRSTNITRSFSVESKVKFRELTINEIEYYIDNYKPYDKAGGYGIQEWIGYVAIEGIEGSFYNVMGLPVCKVYTEIQKFIKEASTNR